MLLSLLLDFESLFDGTLGDWNRPPVSIEMKDGAKPYHGRPYPIPQIHKATLMKDIDRLMGIGVLKRQLSSQWAISDIYNPKEGHDSVYHSINGSSEDHIQFLKSVPHCRS
jgi:hypothetical protein